MVKKDRLNIRITNDEKIKLLALSKKYNMSMSELLLSLILFLSYIQDKNVPLGLALDLVLQTEEFRKEE